LNPTRREGAEIEIPAKMMGKMKGVRVVRGRGKKSEKRSGSEEIGFGCIPSAPKIQWTPVLKL
jgi:hypothetical protein